MTGPPTLQFPLREFRADEGAGIATATITRSGDTSAPAEVFYTTGQIFLGPSFASPRSDYTTAFGFLRFAAGETSKTFNIFLTDDAIVEGDETLPLTLFGPDPATTGSPSQVTLRIIDNDTVPSTVNPIDDSAFFVRQHYRDFLNRDPDDSGFAFWTNEIEQCGAHAACREVKRIDTSAAFFLSIEFQETGYLVYRMFKAAYGDAASPNVAGTVPVIRFDEFMPDTQRIGEGVVVGAGTWQQKLEANKQAYALEFVGRPRFLSAFPAAMTAEEFVAQLDQNAGGVLTADERAQLVAALGATPSDAAKRAAAVRQAAEHAQLRQREFNRAFVLMQFYGYLRREPDAAPDTDFRGWKFWLDKLDEFGGVFRRAEMVKAFISSDEYRKRFGQ